MPIQKSTINSINQALADVNAAEGGLQTARQALADKRGQLQVAEDEIARLDQTLVDSDEIGISRRALLQVKLPLIERALKALEADVERAEGRLEAQKGALRGAFSTAAQEIADQRRAALTKVVSDKEDAKYGEYVGWRGPSVVVATQFARNPELGERGGLSLEQIAEVLSDGRIPPFVPLPQASASLVLLSEQRPWL